MEAIKSSAEIKDNRYNFYLIETVNTIQNKIARVPYQCPGNFILSDSFSKDDVPNFRFAILLALLLMGMFKRQDSHRNRP